MQKTLSELGLTGAADLRIGGLSVDNRKTRPGDLFAALPGAVTHGARFAADALNRGAVAILTDPKGYPPSWSKTRVPHWPSPPP